jgi:protocatechuate 3,4-dioxygenase beta subunit
MTFVVGTTASAQQPASSPAVVAGRVMDQVSGNPVGGATVTLVSVTGAVPGGAPGPSSASAPARRAVAPANDDGRFVFRDVPAGTYTLTSAFPGLSPGAHGQRRPAGPSKPITIADGARESNLIVPMWRLGTISGTVRDDRGEPITGLYVTVLRRVNNNGRFELAFAGGGGEATDDRGRYRATGLLPGTYAVAVHTALRTSPVADVDAYYASASAGTAMPLLRRFRETGVLDQTDSGLVIGEWMVGVSNGDPQPMPGPNGALLIHPTTFYPNARTSGDATFITLAAGADRGGVDMTLPLVQGMRVSGVLTGPDGPAVNYGLRISPVSGGDTAFEIPIVYGMTDSRGRFAFLGVPPGAYVIRVYRVQPFGPLFVPPTAGGAPGTRVEYVDPSASPLPSWFGELPVTVGSTHVDGLSIAMEPGARVSGRIVFDGATQPPPPARLQQVSISIRAQFGPEWAPNDARANAQGQFATQGFAPGRYVVQNVTTPGPEWSLASIRFGTSDAALQAVTIGAQDVGDVVVTFTDKTITLSGDVRAAVAGAPPDATVVLFPADYQAWIASGMSPRRTVTAATSATGAYQFKVPLPGDYLVVAIPPEIAPEIDAEFVKRVSAGGVRVTLAAGDSKTQALTVAKVR